MKRFKSSFKLPAVLAALAAGVFAGCQSDDGGSAHVSGSVYYGTGFYDPWYYGYYDDPDIIVTPPPRPETPPHPAHPIATPPVSRPRPTPMPSLPAPRPSFRR
jgi:hypothetical protein